MAIAVPWRRGGGSTVAMLFAASLLSLATSPLKSQSIVTGSCFSVDNPFVFCNGCRYRFKMTVRRSTPCSGSMRLPTFTTSAGELRELTVVRRAKNGVAGVSGPSGYAYSPRQGYAGTDEFELMLRYATTSGREESLYFAFDVEIR